MTFGRYLLYRLKSSALRSVIFALISAVIVMFVVVDINSDYIYDSGLYMSAIVLGIFATLIPMLETACFKNRRNLDTLYCMPIRRGLLALAHYLSGFIQVVFIYSVSFFATYIYLGTKDVELRFMMVYYLYVLLLGLVLYSIFIFVFSEANTVVDGVVLSIGWMFAFWMILYAVFNVVRDLGFGNSTWWIYSWGIIYEPLDNLTTCFQNIIEHRGVILSMDMWFGIFKIDVQWILLGIAAAVGYFYNMHRVGAENAGEVSNSWFGYRVLIPIYGYSALLIIDMFDILSLLVLAGMVIGYIIYRRSFKFRLSDYIVLGIGIILSAVAGF